MGLRFFISKKNIDVFSSHSYVFAFVSSKHIFLVWPGRRSGDSMIRF